MANIKISDLPLATTLDGTEEIPIVQGGTTKKTHTGSIGQSTTISGGAIDFVQLTDVPQSYVGAALETVRVNAAETGLEFTTATLADGDKGDVNVSSSGTVWTVQAVSGNPLGTSGAAVPLLSGTNTWSGDQSVPDEAYGITWNNSLEVPTKNALYNKIETIQARTALVADTTYYVRSTPQEVTITNASPASVQATSHGYLSGYPVVFHVPENLIADVSISSTTPAVVTASSHGRVANDPIFFMAQGNTPNGVTANTTYYVSATGLTGNTFQFSTNPGTASVATTSASSMYRFYLCNTGAIPTGLTEGTVYYVSSAGLTSSSFQVSSNIGSAPINTTTTQSGHIFVVSGSTSITTTGSAATPTAAFLRSQDCYNYIKDNIDTAGFTATIQYADSKYTTTDGIITFATPWVGGGVMLAKGNQTYPTNANIFASDDNFSIQCTIPAYLQIDSLQLGHTGNNDCIGGQSGQGKGHIYFRNCSFTAADWHVAARVTGLSIESRNDGTVSVGHTNPGNPSQGYSHLIRNGGSPGGHSIAINGGTVLLDCPYSIVNNVAIGNLAYAVDGGVISQNNGGFPEGFFTGTIYYARGAHIQNWESFSNQTFWATGSVASWNSTGNRNLDAGGSYGCSASLGSDTGQREDITFILGGSTTVIASGVAGYLKIPYPVRSINRVTLLADQVGSISVDIWKSSFAVFPPSSANSITGTSQPTITSTLTFQSSTLSGWTTALNVYDILAFNVISSSLVTKVDVILNITKGLSQLSNL